MKKPTQGLITATRSPAEEREAHMNTVTHKIKQPLERVLPAVGLRIPFAEGWPVALHRRGRVPGLRRSSATGPHRS